MPTLLPTNEEEISYVLEDNSNIIRESDIDSVESVDNSVGDSPDDESTNPTISYQPLSFTTVEPEALGTEGDVGEDPEEIPDEDPVVFPEATTTDVIVKTRFFITDYSEENLQQLHTDGGRFYVIYDDETEDEVLWTEVYQPERTTSTRLQLEADQIGAASNQHFWDDTNGAHVTNDTQDDWLTEYDKTNHGALSNPTEQNPWHNILINSYGLLLRMGLIPLSAHSRSGISFYDGLGDSSSHILAFLSNNTIQIGKTNDKHLVITNSGITVYNGDGTIAPLTASNIQAIEAVINNLSANYAHISNGVIDNAKIGHADVNGLSANYAHITNGIIDNATIDKAKVNGLSATYATIENLNTANARITSLEGDHVTVSDFQAEQAKISALQADHVSVSDFQAEQANIDNLQAATADIATIRANSAKVANLTAQQLEADHATVGALDTNYAQVNMANVNNAWIQNGTVKDGAITNAMINSVSANKLTAGTIDASNITVTNLNADNITAGTLNGQRIGAGTLSLDKLDEDVYTETEVDGIVQNLQTQIDGAIETWTGTVIPTLQNAPAVNWNTNSIKDTHVGDVYFVVNSQSDQNGYNYRFTKTTSGGTSTYSWQLIKDNDVTNALQRLTNAEGRIGTIETFDSTVSSFMTNTDQELTSIKSAATTLAGRVTTAEGTLATKVDTTTFNSLSQTVDGHSSSITQLTTETTTLTQAVDTLNTKTSSDSGNIVQFSDSIGFKEIVVHGKSEQTSYTGKNLFDETTWINDGRIPNADTGVLASSSASHRSELMQLDAGTYTYSLVNGYANGPKYVHAYDSNGTWLRRLVATTAGSVGTTFTVSFTITSDIAAICIVAQNADTNVQIELGSTATSYEPYVGGKPSPNPEYPQEINSVDDLTLHVCGKNLFDRNGEESGYVWTDGKKYDASGWLVSSFIPVAAEVTYTFSPNTTAGGTAKGCFYDINRTFIAGSAFNSGPITVTAPSGAAYARFSYRDTSTNVQLEIGETSTDYEPYQGQSIDIPLGDHQIRSLPDGTDDTLTFSYIGPSIREGWGLYNAELVQKIDTEIFDGSESGWTKSTGYPGGYYLNAWAYNKGIVSSNKHIQDYFTTAKTLNDYSIGTCYFDSSLNFRLDNNEIATLNDFKAWLSENPVTVQYILATPITHSLGVVELPLSEDLNLWASTSPSTTIDATWWHEPGRAEKNAIDISLTSSNLGDAIDSTTLSAPYTEVEWVESNGAQYVYLDWKPPIETWGFEADFIIQNAFTTSVGAWNPNTNTNGYGNVFGTRNTSLINDIQLGTYSTNGIIRWGQTGNDSAGLFKKDKTRQQISLRDTTLTKADGTTVTITRSTENDSKFYANMAVFCMHEGLRRGATGNLVQPGSVRLYSLKFYDGDELKVDLIGAIRNRDGVTGLYDKVKDHFYPAYGMTYGDVVGDLGIPDTILEAVAKSKINVHIDNRQISRMWRAEVPELNRLEDGQTISVTFSTNIGATTPAAAGLVGWDETATTAYSNVFLKLVLTDETETDWIPCFYNQGTRLTSHYGSGMPILLTYRENVLYGASTTNAGTSVMRAWYADPNYVDGNTQYTKYSNSVIAGLNGIKRYTLCMKDQNGKWTSIINQANTVAATKTCYTGGLQLDTILYYSPANEIAAGNNSSDGLWESFGIIDWRYSFNVENNATNGLTYRTPLYLVGTLSNSDGLFYLDTTKWWTQAPNDPTKIYVWVSAGYTNYYQGILSVQNTVYAYDEDAGLIEINVSRYSKTTTKLNQTIDTVDEHTRKIGVLETTVETKANSSEVTTISNKLNTVSDTVDGHTQTISSVQTTVNGLGTRVTAAESNITQNATNINLKVSKDGVISSINQSAESVKIDASKVEIDGTAIFNSISSSVDNSISNSISSAKLVKTTQDQWYSSTSATTKSGGSWATTQPSIVAGRYIWQRQYVTYSDNTTAYLPSEAGVCTQGQTDLSGYSTTSQMTSAIGTAKQEALAVAQSAVDVTHRIYYRTQTANSSLAAPTTWVEEATGNVYNQWTTKVPPLAASTATGQTKYLYLYTCEQRKRLDGTTLCTKVLLDENTTVIDGGSIITNSVTANQIAAGAITADQIQGGSLTIGLFGASAQADILNSNVVVPSKVSELANDSNFATIELVNNGIETGTEDLYDQLTNISTDLYGSATIDSDGNIDDSSRTNGIFATVASLNELSDSVSGMEDSISNATSTLNDRIDEADETVNDIHEALYGTDSTSPIFATSEEVSNGYADLTDSMTTLEGSLRDDISNSVNGVESRIINRYDSTKTELDKLRGYIRVDVDDNEVPYLELGQVGNEVTVHMTNSTLDFKTSNEADPVASIGSDDDGGLLKVTRANIGQLDIGEHSQGHWEWQQRANGNLALKWIAAQS